MIFNYLSKIFRKTDSKMRFVLKSSLFILMELFCDNLNDNELGGRFSKLEIEAEQENNICKIEKNTI